MNTPRLSSLLACVLALACPALKADLVYYLPFDSGSNPSLANDGTAGGTATISGTPAPTASSTSVAPNIGSTYSEYWQTPTSNATGSVLLPSGASQFRMNTAGNQMSMSTWIYWNGSHNGTALSGIVNAINGSNNIGWSLYITSDGTLRFLYNTPSSNFLARSSAAGSISAGTWLNVAITLDVSTTSPFRMYVNGSSVFSSNLGNITLNTTTQEIGLGSVDGGRSLNGNMDDFAMWNTVLSAAKIKALNTAPVALNGYNAGVMNTLFNAFDTQSSTVAGSITWTYATGFDVAGRALGDTWLGTDGKYYLWLDGASNNALGLMGTISNIPEPGSTALLMGGGLLVLLACRRNRRHVR